MDYLLSLDADKIFTETLASYALNAGTFLVTTAQKFTPQTALAYRRMGHLTVPLKHLLLEMDLLLTPPQNVYPDSVILGLLVVETIFRINACEYISNFVALSMQ